ncbi:MAG: 1-acyl-sn-glycerol-3-phosphate acyltransferase [Deltaproteobacteria bacterium]|nr:1-acyl-sn-glycerol-3-phosphate acyltransferase [Deltaproteobacteria bacterium]
MTAEAMDQDESEGGAERRTRYETFAEAKERLSWLERLNIAFIKHTFVSPWLDGLLLWFQRVPGVFWVHHCTKHIRHVYGLERLGPMDSGEAMILVSNHRSFFDMFVVNMVLYKHGFQQRLLFPVRSNFFYDHPLGFFVNGIMSWFSMYPPIFRDRKRVVLNHTAFSELSNALKTGRSCGIHPEGKRKTDDDPYTLLPAQPGVGRLIHLSRAKVIPIFINGLGNDLKRQIGGNFDGTGKKVILVFGPPIDFGELLDLPPKASTYRTLADKTVEAITALGQEERALRAQLEPKAEA